MYNTRMYQEHKTQQQMHTLQPDSTVERHTKTTQQHARPCAMSGGTTLARSDSLCAQHRRGRCVVPDCATCALRGETCTQHIRTRPPPASPSHSPAIERMQALTCAPRYSGPSWLEICAMLHRAHHVQPTSLATTPRIHTTPTQIPEPADHDHVMVEGFGILVSHSPGPGLSPLQ